jgi:hypothetical protein
MKNGFGAWGLASVLLACAAPVFGQPPSQTTTQPATTSPYAARPGANAGPLADSVLPPPTPGGPAVPLTEGGVQPSRVYIYGEYLLWWLRQDKVPPLSTTSSNPFDNGILGRPTTLVLFGGDGIDGSARSGFGFGAGYWLDDCCKQEWVGVRGFYLSPRDSDFNANSAQFPTLARPFFNVNQNIEFAELTAFPGRFTGRQSFSESSKFFGAEVNGGCIVCCGCNYNVGLYGGFRFIELEESLGITESLQGLPTAPAPFTNTSVLLQEYFGTHNQFYGGQVGVSGEYDYQRVSFEGFAQVALGDTHQSILIDGQQFLTPPGGPTQRSVGGLLAERSNIGRYHRERFSVVPEVGFNVGFLLTSHIRPFIGYDFLYWNNVVRPGTQIDRGLDITQIPNFNVPGVAPVGQNRPTAPQNSTDIWAQGLRLGLEFRF